MNVPHAPVSKRIFASRFSKGRLAVACCVAIGFAPLSSGAGASGSSVSHDTKSVVISTLKTTKFGTILVSGTTLYTLIPSGVACGVTCQKYWPEVLLPEGTTRAIAGVGVKASQLGTLTRPGGLRQVTYLGRALYRFVLDTAPGQVRGNVSDTWGRWSDVVTSKPVGTVKSTTTTVKQTTTTTLKSTTTTNAPETTTTVPPTTTTVPSGGGVGF